MRAATVSKNSVKPVGKPRLDRVSLLKEVLQGFRIALDERLHPHGITTAQLRLLWAIESNPEASGAQLARLCSVTPQTGQATLARVEASQWIRRHPSASSDRILLAELTPAGKRVLLRAKQIAEDLNQSLWTGLSKQNLSIMDEALKQAVSKLPRH